MRGSLPAIFGLFALAVSGFSIGAQEPPVVVQLPALDADKAVAAVPGLLPGALFGIGRVVPQEPVGTALAWQRTPDGGWESRVRIVSRAGVGLRLALKIDNLPDDATLRFSGAAGSSEVVAGSTINASIQTNRRDSPTDLPEGHFPVL